MQYKPRKPGDIRGGQERFITGGGGGGIGTKGSQTKGSGSRTAKRGTSKFFTPGEAVRQLGLGGPSSKERTVKLRAQTEARRLQYDKAAPHQKNVKKRLKKHRTKGSLPKKPRRKK